MPHLIFQTKFPARDQTAEITFFGALEKETMEAIKTCTIDALRYNESPAPPAAVWKSTPPNVCRLEFTLPEAVECRHTLLNVLRVSWMDVFECAGWGIVSMWHANSRATNSLDAPPAPQPASAAPADDEFAAGKRPGEGQIRERN
ncbi:hypothetical protein T484DRAFT_1906187 [Baffinella frigidus]|nr:hypothetical protein T484DRAFT_1906187 [Cryptophyta sp. CCMP2293]